MLLTPALFGQLAQAMGVFVLVCALITGLAVAFNWSWRYRMVGATLFSVVLVVGLFSLSFEPIEGTTKRPNSTNVLETTTETSKVSV